MLMFEMSVYERENCLAALKMKIRLEPSQKAMPQMPFGLSKTLVRALTSAFWDCFGGRTQFFVVSLVSEGLFCLSFLPFFDLFSMRQVFLRMLVENAKPGANIIRTEN